MHSYVRKWALQRLENLLAKHCGLGSKTAGHSVFAGGGAGLPSLPLGYGPGTPCHPVMTDGHVFQCDIAPVGDATAQ